MFSALDTAFHLVTLQHFPHPLNSSTLSSLHSSSATTTLTASNPGPQLQTDAIGNSRQHLAIFAEISLITESMTSNPGTVDRQECTRTPPRDDDNVSKTLSNDDRDITHQLAQLGIVGIYHPLRGNARQFGARSHPVAESSTTAARDNCQCLLWGWRDDNVKGIGGVESKRSVKAFPLVLRLNGRSLLSCSQSRFDG